MSLETLTDSVISVLVTPTCNTVRERGGREGGRERESAVIIGGTLEQNKTD